MNDYVLDLAEITEGHTLTNAFIRINNDRELVGTRIKSHLQTYLSSMDRAAELL